MKKAKIFRRTKIIIGKPFEFEEYYGKKITEEDINAMSAIIREKMIAEQQKLSLITTKKKDKKDACIKE